MTLTHIEALEHLMDEVEEIIGAHQENHPGVDLWATPEGTHRDDMEPIQALAECFDLWASGAWDSRNAEYDAEEVRRHLDRHRERAEADR